MRGPRSRPPALADMLSAPHWGGIDPGFVTEQINLGHVSRQGIRHLDRCLALLTQTHEIFCLPGLAGDLVAARKTLLALFEPDEAVITLAARIGSAAEEVRPSRRQQKRAAQTAENAARPALMSVPESALPAIAAPRQRSPRIAAPAVCARTGQRARPAQGSRRGWKRFPTMPRS